MTVCQLSGPVIRVCSAAVRSGQLPAAMSSLTGGLSPDLGPGAVKRPLEDGAGDSGPRTEAGNKKYKQDLANLPTRQYLDQTVVPILLQVTRRPHQWVITYQSHLYLDWTWTIWTFLISFIFF